jgi:hypothetical protein
MRFVLSRTIAGHLWPLVVASVVVGWVIFPEGLDFQAAHRSGGNSGVTSGDGRINGFPWGVPENYQDQLVRYPKPEIAFICGPQLKAGSSLNPAPWFDSTARSMGIIQGNRNPRIAPFGPMVLDPGTSKWQNVIAGRLSVARGSRVVTGVGTMFRLDVDAGGSSPSYNGRMRIRDAGGVEREVQVRSVESDTSLTLMAPWGYGNVSNTVADTYHVDPNEGPNTDHYYSDNYYDTVLVQYINYYRTGEVKFLEYARKMADARWHSQWVGDGTVTGGPNHLPPRSMAFAGLMLRALDGRPEMWDYLEREVRTTFEVWVYLRKNNRTLFSDLRDDGYAQLYAVLLAKVLPDSYPLYGNGTLQPSTGMATDGAAKRTRYRSQAEDTAVNYFGRLQRADGSWRWNADTSSNPNEQYRDVEQPFMVGLYLESVILLHQLSNNQTARANLKQQLTRSVNHLYTDAYLGNATVTDFPQYRWRGMFYFWGGGTVANPRSYSPPQPSTTAHGDLNSWVRGTRHLNSTIHHAFGYAYHITGDPRYRSMGDEVFDASYGEQVDGLHCLADSGKGKDYAMNYRASGHYLVWRLSGGSHEKVKTPPESPTQNASAGMTRQHSPQTSKQLLADCVTLANSLASSMTDKRQIKGLLVQIETTRRALDSGDKSTARAPTVFGELEAALANVRTALSIAETESAPYDSARIRIGWAAARLKRAVDVLRN